MKKAYMIAALFFVVLAAGCVGTGQIAAAPQSEEQEILLNNGKIVLIQSAYSDIILMVAAGTQPVNTSELKVFVDSAEQRCIWDKAVAEPGQQFACQLEEICAAQIVTVVSPGNFDQAQC